jgi:hypothetical protein
MPGDPERRRRAAPAWLLIALLVALAPRTFALDWGLPDATHPYSFHPDEYNVPRALAAMDPARLDLNPRYFHNPTLYYYLCGAGHAALRSLGIVGPLDRLTWHRRPADVARFYRLGRLLSAVAGAATAVVVAAWAGRVAGRRAAALAAALAAAAPAHVVLSHYMDVDALLGLLGAATLLACDRVLTAPGAVPALVAGAAAGLAVSSKYNGVLLLLPLALAVVLGPAPGRPRRLVLALATAAAAFLVATPYAVLDWPAFRDGVAWVARERVGGRWTDLGHGPLFPLVRTWPWLFGELALALAAWGGLRAWRRHRRRFAPALLLLAATYLSVAWTGTDYVRYSVLALPPLALAAALTPLDRPWALGLALVAVLGQVARTAPLLALLAAPDVRVEASRWLEREVPPGATVVVPREPYFHSPPRLFVDYFYRGRSPAWREPQPRFLVENAGWDPVRLDRPDAGLVVLSEHEMLYPAQADGSTARFLERLLDGGSSYREVARFDRPATLFGVPLEARLPGPGWRYRPAAAAALRDRRLPHDLKYLNPAVLVLARRPS